MLYDTGWCGACSNMEPHTYIKPNQRFENWLTKNANDIEDLMQLLDLKASEAIRIITADNPPESICAICGNNVKRTRHQNFFCSSTPECLKARRYYKYLVYEKNTDKEDAFNRTVRKYK